MTDKAARLRALLERLAAAMANQRIALENSDFDNLESTLAGSQAALEELLAYPGGVDSLRADLLALPEPDRSQARDVLERAGLDHRVGRELVQVAMQRSAAVQAFAASQSDGATYSQQGGVSTAAGSLLSRKA